MNENITSLKAKKIIKKKLKPGLFRCKIVCLATKSYQNEPGSKAGNTVEVERLINSRPLSPRDSNRTCSHDVSDAHSHAGARLGPGASTLQIYKHHLQSAIHIDALQRVGLLGRGTNTMPIDLTVHQGSRKNSLQQYAGVTINTLMISRDRREKTSGDGRRYPSHSFQKVIQHNNISFTEHHLKWHNLTWAQYVCNPRHWFCFGYRMMFFS